MRDKSGRKLPNPIEPLLCNHCHHVGLRYQGIKKTKSGESRVFRCVECGRNSNNPGASVTARVPAKKNQELCQRHWVPKDFMERAFKIQTMSWRV